MITFDLEPEEITWLNTHKQSGTPEQKSNMFTRAASGCGANAKGGHGFQPGNTCAKENGDNSSQEYKPVTAGATVQEGGFGGMREGFNIAAPGGARVNGYLYDADFGNKSSSKTRGELFFIEVPKDQRRNGLATSLATDAIRLMQRNGAKTVSMHPMQPGAKELNARLVANGVLGKIVDTTESGKVEYEIIDDSKDAATKELEHGSRITIPASHTYGEMPVEVRRDGKYVTFVYDPGGVRESKLITFDEDEAKSFLADLRGELPHQPNSGNKILDSAIENKAELLGHGQGGIVFDGGDKIIKAASRIPYHWNNGLRTQEQANAKLQSEINIVNTLQDKGIPGLLPLTPVMHEGRLFAIRDKVSMDGLDQQAIDDAGDAIEKMHNAGFIMRDQVQIGMGDDGKFRFYDVGEAAPYNKDDMYAKEDKGMDHSSLARVAEKAGLKYIVPDDRDAGLKLDDAFTEAYGAVEGDSIGNLMTRRLGLKIAYDRLKRQEPDMAELYSEAYDELMASFRRRHNELSEAKKQVNTTQKSILPSTLFTRGSDCGANTDGGHGFQPGNTCGKKGNQKDKTDTPEFKRWFGDSKVVDKDGNPLIVHHGTPHGGFTEFISGQGSETGGIFGQGFYFTTSEQEAESFKRDSADGEVKSVYLKIEKPFSISEPIDKHIYPDIIQAVETYHKKYPTMPSAGEKIKLAREAKVTKLVESLKTGNSTSGYELRHDLEGIWGDYVANKIIADVGFDGTKVKASDGHDWWVVFKSKQIKSATGNAGTFDPNDANITKSFQHNRTALFTRAASGCGANTDGGHGFQPGNTCASGGDGKTEGESKPRNPGLRRKLAQAFYGTKQDHKQILDMADPAHASASDLEDPEKVKRIKEMIATPEERQQHQKVLQKVLETLPPKMADRISKNVRDVKLCGSPEMVGVLAGKGTKTNSVFGFYRPGSRELVMDGGPDQQQGADEKSLTQTGIYAHELAHAADKIGFHRTFSETEAWKQAFQSEIDNDQVPLSNYARVNRQEGFAEFVRLMVTNPDEAKTKFPKCSKAVQSAYGSF